MRAAVTVVHILTCVGDARVVRALVGVIAMRVVAASNALTFVANPSRTIGAFEPGRAAGVVVTNIAGARVVVLAIFIVRTFYTDIIYTEGSRTIAVFVERAFYTLPPQTDASITVSAAVDVCTNSIAAGIDGTGVLVVTIHDSGALDT